MSATSEAPFMTEPVVQQIEYVGEHRAVEEIATTTGWKQRFGQIATRAALTVGITIGGGAIVEGAHSTPAYAAEDYGDYLSGKYANETGCDQGAVTLDEADITQQNYTLGLPWGISASGEVKVGTVQLRYSPKCKTKWALVETTTDNGVSDVAVTQDTGYNQGRHIGGYGTGSPPAISQSPMIYSPDNKVHAYVAGGSGDLINTSTGWK